MNIYFESINQNVIVMPTEEPRTGQLTTNFHIREFKCKDGTQVPAVLIPNVIKLANNLQVLRDHLGEPIHINSGYRTKAWNESRPGSAKNSQHLEAKAADITCKSKSPGELADIIEELIRENKMAQGGIGRYPGFVHYDVRGTVARW